MGPHQPLVLMFLLQLLPLSPEAAWHEDPKTLRHLRHLQSLTRSGASDHWVRLCGRDFFRAIAFTCGGSRFKRTSTSSSSPSSAPEPGHLPPEFIQMNSDNGLENFKLESVLDPIQNELQPMSQLPWPQSLKDKFDSYDNEHVPTSDNFNEYIHQAKDAPRNRDEARLVNSMGSSYLPWGKHSRKKRSFHSELAAMCCKWGCSKNELYILC